MMQALGRRYVRYINGTYRRTGTLWEGRFKSCVVDTEHYLLTCYHYIEFNPLRAKMVAQAEEYRWSSYRCNAFAQPDALISPHPAYQALGNLPEERADAYRQLCEASIASDDLAAIRAHIEQERALGSRRFQEIIEATLKRSVRLRGPGRPRKDLRGTGNVL